MNRKVCDGLHQDKGSEQKYYSYMPPSPKEKIFTTECEVFRRQFQYQLNVNSCDKEIRFVRRTTSLKFLDPYFGD